MNIVQDSDVPIMSRAGVKMTCAAPVAQDLSMAKQSPWHPMKTAPRDGSLIVALYKNQTGVVLLRWGETTTSPQLRWSSADWSKQMKTDADYSGWMPADPLPQD